MTLIEKDFSKFLIELGYSESTAKNYPCYLKKFAIENGYDNLIDLADDVFSLLDKGIHEKREFSKKTLSAVKKYNSVLKLFNGFLFDIKFERKFAIHCPPSMNYIQVLTTDKKYIPNIQPRTLKDSDNPERQWFTVDEVIGVLHITDHVLQRWEKLSENKKHERCIPHKYKGPNDYNIDISVNTGANEKRKCTDYKYNYYILKELNDFLEYQFDYGKGVKREQYLSDDDIRKSTKKSKHAV